MATKKVTVTLDADQVDRIRSLVESGEVPSVSGFVQHAVRVALDDVAGWGAMLADALRGTGGALSEEERRWADETLGTETLGTETLGTETLGTKRRRRRSPAA
jgi:Arc/MetJ-type ribon-helix-helix transcriptional regulator